MVNKMFKPVRLSKKNRYYYDGLRQWFYAPSQKELEVSVRKYCMDIENAHNNASKSTLKFD
jgi:hypothetical protein